MDEETWLQKDGELPYRPWVRFLNVDKHDPPAWLQKDGELPYRPWVEFDDSHTNDPFAWTQKKGELPKRPWIDFDDSHIHDPFAWTQKKGELPKRPWVEFDDLRIHDPSAWTQKRGELPKRPWVPYKEAEASYPDSEDVTIPEIDWTASMKQTYEYYIVDTETWGDDRRLEEVIKCTIQKDETSETLGSSTIETTELIDENYIRTYMIISQNGFDHKICLGTFLYMTSDDDYDGIVHTYSITGYSPLTELKENLPPLGYFIEKGKNILERVSEIIPRNSRIKTAFQNAYSAGLGYSLGSDFVADPSDTWLQFIIKLISSIAANSYILTVDEYGVVGFDKYDSSDRMSPIWTYSDDNSSILLPELTQQIDLYGIPNVVEVVYSGESGFLYSRAVNDDPDSPVSTVNRKREIVQRVSNVNIPGDVNQEMIDNYARIALENASTIQHKISYSHGYCPVRIGDCVLLNYKRAGLENIKARVQTQTINCDVGCTVNETAVYSTKLWRAD